MSAERQIAQHPRARPVADAPAERLLGRVDELARRWAIELIVERPLAAMAEIALEDLAREAPRLCAALLRALTSDAELALLVGGQDPGGEGSAEFDRLAAIAGARDPRSLVEQVEALRGVLWQAILAELQDPPARLVADLSDRLALICSALLAATLERSGDQLHRAPEPPVSVPAGQIVYRSTESAPGAREAVLVDERTAAQAPPRGGPRVAVRGRLTPSGAAQRPTGRAPGARIEDRPMPPSASGTPRPWDTPLGGAPGSIRSQAEPGDQERAGGAEDEPPLRVTRRGDSRAD